MARFYLVSNRATKSAADKDASLLKKALKEFGLPHETKVTHSDTYGWLIYSTATVSQIQRMQNFKNVYPRDVLPSLKDVDDKGFLKHLKKGKKSIVKHRKTETRTLKSEMVRISSLKKRRR